MGASFLNLSPVFIEIGQRSLVAYRDGQILRLPLDRAENGRLADSSKGRSASSLAAFLSRKTWAPRVRAFCAIGAQGVSLRRVSLPASAGENTRKLLLLRIETEFPLSPDELAWGHAPLGLIQSDGQPAQQQFLVAAVRKEVIEDYAEVLLAGGGRPVFTVAALIRCSLCPDPLLTLGVIELGSNCSELITFENGAPDSLRVLPPISRVGPADAGLAGLAEAFRRNRAANRLYYTGAEDGIGALELPEGIERKRLPVMEGDGASAAISGLKKMARMNGASGPLILRTKIKPLSGAFRLAQPALSQPAPRKWAGRAAALACGLLLLPYAEALLLKPFLARRLAAVEADKGRLATIDRELNFLQFYKQNQPSYLDALFLLAKATPSGARMDSLSMNRRGEISMRGTMRNGNDVTDFRSKLIESAFFANVTIEEQSPTPDRQKVNVRISVQWKPAEDRAGLAVGPTAAEIEKARTNAPPQGGPPISPGPAPPRPPRPNLNLNP